MGHFMDTLWDTSYIHIYTIYIYTPGLQNRCTEVQLMGYEFRILRWQHWDELDLSEWSQVVQESQTTTCASHQTSPGRSWHLGGWLMISGYCRFCHLSPVNDSYLMRPSMVSSMASSVSPGVEGIHHHRERPAAELLQGHCDLRTWLQRFLDVETW